MTSILVSHYGVCYDEESGISHAQIWVGSAQDGVADLTPVQAVSVTNKTGTVLSITPQTEYADDLGCVLCGNVSYVGLRCINNANVNATFQPYASFRVDGTPPECSSGAVILGEGLVPAFQSEVRQLTVTNLDVFADRETGIRRMSYILEDFGSLLDADAALDEPISLTWVDHQYGPPPDLTIRLQSSLRHGHSYHIKITAINYVGLSNADCLTSVVTIDLTPPVVGLVVLLQKDTQNSEDYPSHKAFQTSTEIIRVAARNLSDAESAVLYNSVAVYRSDGWLVQSETQIGDLTFQQFPVELQDRRSYYCVWKTYNQAELSTSVRTSLITVDVTAPIIDYVRESFGSGVRTLSSTDVDAVAGTEVALSCFFAARDDESTVQAVEWCLGTFPGSCDYTGNPISLSSALSETLQSIGGLVDGRWYWSTIQARNGAGAITAVSSDGFQIDVSPPVCAFIYDGPNFDREYVGPTLAQAYQVYDEDDPDSYVWLGYMQVSWSGIIDLYTGIGGYAVASVAEDLVEAANATNTEWIALGSTAGSTEIYRTLVHAVTYVSVISVWDLLHNEQKCLSNGVLFDATPPDTTFATLRSFLSLTGDNVQKYPHIVHAEVTGIFDSESGVAQYYAAIGLNTSSPEAIAEFRSIGTSEGEMIIGGLTMPEGGVLLTIRAQNNAKETSDVSLPFGVDITPPVCDAIAIFSNPAGQLLQYTLKTSSIEATWNCHDATPWEAVDITCAWSIGSSPLGTDVLEFQNVSASGRHEFSCDTCLQNGVIYWVNLLCTDQVGLITLKTSGGVMPDLVAPSVAVNTTVVTRYTGRTTKYWGYGNELALLFGFDDLESGLQDVRAGLLDTIASPLIGDRDAEGLLTLPIELPIDADGRQTIIDLQAQGVSLVHAHSYYVHVCARDQLNHTVCAEPYSFSVDLEPPTCDDPIDLIGGLTAPAYFSSWDPFGASWACDDPESGVDVTVWTPYSQDVDGTITQLLTRSLTIASGTGTCSAYRKIEPSRIAP